jgi:SPP1 gp7 family putative phage head morphogenesis protein
LFDSVFTAHFQKGIPFKSDSEALLRSPLALPKASADRPITPVATITKEMGRVEVGGKALLQKELHSSAMRAANELKDAIANKDFQAINKYKWSAVPALSKAIWGVWVAGWNLGGTHADRELDKKTAKAARFNSDSNIAYFEENVRRASIRNTSAEDAIRERVNKLASDVSNSEWNRIKSHLIDSISPPAGRENPISRDELIDRINTELGSKSGRFASRAEAIARTETTFAYNAGRLDTYQRSGLVYAVQYMSIDDLRRCDICLSCDGLVVLLSDTNAIARIMPPRHTSCRCVITSILNTPGDREKADDPDRQEKNRSIVPAPPAWMTAAILAALLVGGITAATKMKGRIRQIATEIGEVGATVAGVGATAETVRQINRGEQPDADEVPVTPTEPDGGSPGGVPVEDAAPKVVSVRPQILVGGIDLNTASFDEIAALLPRRLLKVDQIKELIKWRNQFPLDDLNDLYKIPKIGKKTGDALKALAQNLNVVTDLNNVRSWQQLWATNAGLSKKQAQALFEEIKRQPLASIDDLRSRTISGVGEKSIDALIERSFITQQSVKQRQKQTQVQRVGVGQDPRIPTPGGRSRPEALERGKRKPPPDDEPPTPEGGSPTPPRTPSPYSGGGSGRVEPTPSRPTAPTPKPSPPVDTGRSRGIDPARQQALSNLSKQLDYLDGQAAGLDADLLNEMSKKRLFGKSPNQVYEDVRSQASAARSQQQAIASDLNNTASSINSLGQRTDRMQQVFNALTDPKAPNYFERVPQAISSAKAEVRKIANSTDKALSDIDKAISSLDSGTSSLDDAIRQASTKKVQQIEQGLQDINARLDDWNNLASQLEDLEEMGSDYLSQLQRLRDKQQAIQAKLAQSQNNTRSQYASTLEGVGDLKDDLRVLRSQVSDTRSQIQKLQQQLDNLPTTRQQLDPSTRAKYDSSVKVRQLQRQFTKDLQTFRTVDRQVQQNLQRSSQNQLDFYNRYDQQFTSYEQSTSPLLEKQLNNVQSKVAALSRYQPGTIAWLREFLEQTAGSDKPWMFESMPSEVGLALRGVAANERVERIKALARDVQKQLDSIDNSIKTTKYYSQFRYLEEGQRLTQAEVVKRAEGNLTYWQKQANDLVSPGNIGSTSNRIDNVAKGTVSPEPNDTLGLSRRIAQNLDEWQSRYQDLTQGATAVPGITASDDLVAQLDQARESFLQEAGRSRIGQSQIVNEGLVEAQDIYQRVRADSSRVPVFDVNGTSQTAEDILASVKGYEEQMAQFKKLSQYKTEPIPLERGNLKRINELAAVRDELADQLDSVSNQLTEAQRQLQQAIDTGRGTKRLEKTVNELQQQQNQLQAQANDAVQEIRDLRLPREIYNQIQELKGEITRSLTSRDRLSQELSYTVRQLTPLLEQPSEGLSQAAQRRQAQIQGLQSKRDRLSQGIINLNQRVNQLAMEVNRLRNLPTT